MDDASGDDYFPMGADLTQENESTRVAQTAIERMGHMAVYLASEESKNVTGQGLLLAGGAWMV